MISHITQRLENSIERLQDIESRLCVTANKVKLLVGAIAVRNKDGCEFNQDVHGDAPRLTKEC